MVVLLIFTEVGLRIAGLGSTPVYIEHPTYEYIYAPNQNTSRFGNSIITNEFSMRCKPLKRGDKVKVLKIGDSVINGGAHLDHEDLASTILERKVQKQDATARVLNVSAGSWGPDNAMAYLSEHGHFGTSTILMVFSSHDYHDNRHFRTVVGEHPTWPKEQPFCAITDAWSNYILPRLTGGNDYDYLSGFDNSAVNSGWTDIPEYCHRNGIRLICYLHPEVSEVENGRFNENGKSLCDLLSKKEVEWFSGLDYKPQTEYYRDNIHLNSSGHAHLAKVLNEILEEAGVING